jgi:hypothetical protein
MYKYIYKIKKNKKIFATRKKAIVILKNKKRFGFSFLNKYLFKLGCQWGTNSSILKEF